MPNIIIFPAQNGIKVLLLFVILNRVFNRKLHYVVIELVARIIREK